MSSSTAAERDLGIHTQPPRHPLEVLSHEGAAAAQGEERAPDDRVLLAKGVRRSTQGLHGYAD